MPAAVEPISSCPSQGQSTYLFPAWSVRFAGWPGAEPFFFPRQAGAFHFVAVLGYLLEYHRSRGVTLMVGTKAIAFVFLIAAWAGGEPAWSVPFSGLADGAMGLAAVLLHRAARAERAAKPPGDPTRDAPHTT